MANTNRDSLQTEDDTSEMNDLFSEETWEEERPFTEKKHALSDQKKGVVRRSIEEIKERKLLKDLLGDDFDDLDYLDS